MDKIGLNEPPQLEPGQKVRVMAGPFKDFVGAVKKVYPKDEKLRVAISFFTRETLIELDFGQVEKD